MPAVTVDNVLTLPRIPTPTRPWRWRGRWPR